MENFYPLKYLYQKVCFVFLILIHSVSQFQYFINTFPFSFSLIFPRFALLFIFTLKLVYEFITPSINDVTFHFHTQNSKCINLFHTRSDNSTSLFWFIISENRLQNHACIYVEAEIFINLWKSDRIFQNIRNGSEFYKKEILQKSFK